MRLFLPQNDCPRKVTDKACVSKQPQEIREGNGPKGVGLDLRHPRILLRLTQKLGKEVCSRATTVIQFTDSCTRSLLSPLNLFSVPGPLRNRPQVSRHQADVRGWHLPTCAGLYSNPASSIAAARLDNWAQAHGGHSAAGGFPKSWEPGELQEVLLSRWRGVTCLPGAPRPLSVCTPSPKG